MEKVIHTSQGDFALDAERDAKIASALESGNYHHQETLDLLPHLMKRGGVAVDIGAHIGTLAIPFSRHAGKVIAFEPTEETFAYLKKNIALNAAPVDARNKGLGFVPGRASTVIVHEFSAAAHTLSLAGGDIEISTLDAEVPAADFIKIDVEGMELSVLQGGSRLLRESQPPILFEVNLFALRRQGTAVSQLQRLLKEYGYQIFIPFKHNGHLVLGRVASLAALATCIAPRSFVLRGPSAPFDVVAIPKTRINKLDLPQLSSLRTLAIFAGQNLANRWHRLTAYLAIR